MSVFGSSASMSHQGGSEIEAIPVYLPSLGCVREQRAPQVQEISLRTRNLIAQNFYQVTLVTPTEECHTIPEARNAPMPNQSNQIEWARRDVSFHASRGRNFIGTRAAPQIGIARQAGRGGLRQV